MKQFYFLLLIWGATLLPIQGQDKILNVGLNLRIDYDNILNTIQPDMSRIVLNTCKIIFNGELYPGITYNFEQRLNNTSALTSDSYTSSTGDAWINFAPKNWKWSFTAGKQDIMFGSFESDYDPSDLYLISVVFDNFTRSQIGVSAHYTHKNHILSFQVSNVTGDQLSYDPNHSFAYTFNSYSNFFKGTLLSSVAYSLIQSGNGHLFNWLSYGNQIRTGNFFTELDSYWGRYRQNMSIDSSQSNYREAENVSLSIREFYRLGKFIPFTKLVADWQRDTEQNRLSRRSWGAVVGLEYYPIPGEDFRLHLVYQYRRNRYGDMWLDREGIEVINQVTAGIKWKIQMGSLLTKRKK